ncbi:Predicted oxidoreductase [Paramicrobacterium humi]|uniref:Predicted oxidoreductase n=2 Tax=Paramicrobacterium humi TaxID=640635 RepID=A0A1H4PE86_9MICO|nr:Predicted oxidoreductase [Microbacterium humi]
MSYRPLGTSGLMVSATGLGCNNFGRSGTVTEDQSGTDAVIGAALDAGITFFDTADMYGKHPGLSETLMGNALRGKRDDVVLATKFGHSGADVGIAGWGAKGSRRYVRLAVEASLRRLQTDWIDLYQLHTPDDVTPIEETLAALDELIVEGKVRYIGHSNLSAWQLVEAEFTARLHEHPRFISAQNQYSLIVRDAERDVLPAANRFGVGFLPYFPLHNGLLTGKFTRSGGPDDSRIMRQRRHIIDDAPWDALEAYRAFCEERGISMLQATFGWLLAQPALASVIAGATSPEQVRQNADAATAWQPSADEVRAISEIFD